MDRNLALEMVRVTEAELTYVAIGADRKPRELPPDGATVLV